MNVSKMEQRVLHALAKGGVVILEKDDARKIVRAACVTREGWYLPGITVGLFKKMKRRRLIASKGGGPYRITDTGLIAVRAQLDNR